LGRPLEDKMKTKIIAITLILGILFSATAFARKGPGLASGFLNTADACGFGVGHIGGFAGIGDEATSVFGAITYGFSDFTEGRLKLGFSDLDVTGADPELMFGADLKYEFMDYYDKSKKQPLDMAFGAFLEFVNYEGGSVWEIGGNLITSIPYHFKSGRRLIPYGRFDLRLEQLSSENANDESDFKIGLNIGAKYELGSDMSIYGEFQFDDNTGLFAGLDFRAF